MARTHIEITANSEIAQKAIDAIGGSWVKANAIMNVVEKGFDKVAGAANKVTQAMRDQGKFFSAVKDDVALASIQIGMAVTDGMIEPMTLAKQANLLMRGDLKLSQDQFNAFAKAAVEIGRATGEDTEAIFDRLSKGALKGSVEAMEEYGIKVDSTGTKTQRSNRIIEEITKRYGGMSIAASDAGEAMDAAANRQQLQLLQTAKQVDGLSQTMTKFKDFYVNEFLASGVDALFGTTLARGKQAEELLDRLLRDERQANLLRIAQETTVTQKQQQITLSLMLHDQEEIVKYASEYSEERSKELKDLEVGIARNKQILTLAQELGLPLNNVFHLNSEIQAMETRRTELMTVVNAEMERWNTLTQAVADTFKAQMMPALEDAATAIGSLLGWKPGAAPPPPPKSDPRTVAAVKRAETEAEMIARVQREAAEEARAAEFERMDAEAAARRQKRIDEITQQQIDDAAYEQRKMDREKRIRDNLDAEFMRREEAARKRQEAADKARLDAIRERAIEVSNVIIQALAAEAKAREGMSRTEYMMKQLSVYMKGEALKYAAKSIGYLAEAAAAAFINPPAAGALVKASALSAAAAVAFGGGAAAASAMAGKSSGSSSASGGAASTTQREAVGGTAEQTRGTVNIIIGGRGVLFGNPDELARKLSEIMNSANRRGRI